MEGKEIIENMTKGEFIVESGFCERISPQHVFDISTDGIDGLVTIWSGVELSKEAETNAYLICEAFNVASQTGLTPLQLHSELEKAKELLKECSRFVDSIQAPRTPAILLKQELNTFLEGSGNKNK